MDQKKNFLTKEGVQKYEEELAYLKGDKSREIAQKLAEARAQGDLSENAEYDAAKDEQASVAARIEELETLLKNVEVVQADSKSKNVSFGSTVLVLDMELNEEIEFKIKGSSEADSLAGSISNESPLGKALIGCKKDDIIEVEAPVGMIKYKVIKVNNK